jgi:hypothetical protein
MKALGANTRLWLHFSIGNTSITQIQVRQDGSMHILSVGDIGHLPPNMQSGTGQRTPDLVVPNRAEVIRDLRRRFPCMTSGRALDARTGSASSPIEETVLSQYGFLPRARLVALRTGLTRRSWGGSLCVRRKRRFQPTTWRSPPSSRSRSSMIPNETGSRSCASW